MGTEKKWRLGGREYLAEHHLIKSEISAKEYAVLLRQVQACKQKLSEEDSARAPGKYLKEVIQFECNEKGTDPLLLAIVEEHE